MFTKKANKFLTQKINKLLIVTLKRLYTTKGYYNVCILIQKIRYVTFCGHKFPLLIRINRKIINLNCLLTFSHARL